MPKLHESDSFFGKITGVWNEGKIINHATVQRTGGERAFEGAGMLHPRHVYVNFGIVKIASPLDEGAENDNIVNDAQIDISGSSFPSRDQVSISALNSTFKMVNTGTSSWTGAFKLAPLGGDPFTTGTTAVPTPPCLPGESRNFSMSGTTPAGSSVDDWQFQMEDGGAVKFGDPTGTYLINTEPALGIPVTLTLLGVGSPSTFQTKYKVAAFGVCGELLAISQEKTIASIPELIFPEPQVEASFVAIETVASYKLYRTESTFPAGSDLATIGALQVLTIDPPEPIAGPRRTLFDQGQVADTDDPAPASGSSVPAKSIPAAAGAASPSTQLANIVDGIFLDGSSGVGVVRPIPSDPANNELFIDFRDSTRPLDNSGLPAADWPRNVRGICFGVTTFVRVFGIDGWGDNIGMRFQMIDGILDIDSGHARIALARVKWIAIENVTATAKIWIGWGDGLGLPFPAHPHPRNFSNNIGTVRKDYHPSFFENGQTASGSLDNKIVMSPIQNDRRGLWRPQPPTNGAKQYEVEYWAERLDTLEGKNWQDRLAGTVTPVLPIVEETG